MSARPIATDDLTLEEQECVRAALFFLRIRLDGWKYVGRALRFEETTLINAANGKRTVTASIAVRIARMLNVSIDELLAGKYPPAGECPKCGYRDTRNNNSNKRGIR